jgi:hypothetical protein
MVDALSADRRTSAVKVFKHNDKSKMDDEKKIDRR